MQEIDWKTDVIMEEGTIKSYPRHSPQNNITEMLQYFINWFFILVFQKCIAKLSEAWVFILESAFESKKGTAL